MKKMITKVLSIIQKSSIILMIIAFFGYAIITQGVSEWITQKTLILSFANQFIILLGIAMCSTCLMVLLED